MTADRPAEPTAQVTEHYDSAAALAAYITKATDAAEAAGKGGIMVTIPKPFYLPLPECRQIIAALGAAKERDEARAALADARRETWEEAAKVALDEPEFPGDMPAEVWDATKKADCETALRAACRATKSTIATALRARGRS